MSEQFAPILEGARYQLLVSWFELLDLLDEASPYDHGFVEHPAAGAVDDVTLHPKPGAGVRARFIRVKWHVDHRSTRAMVTSKSVW